MFEGFFLVGTIMVDGTTLAEFNCEKDWYESKRSGKASEEQPTRKVIQDDFVKELLRVWKKNKEREYK